MSEIKRVLIVDDHPVVVETLRLLIRGAYPDFSVISANNAKDASCLIKSKLELTIAIIDLQLPDGCGMNLIKELSLTQPVPVLAISTEAQETTIEPCIKYGASGFVHKSAELSDYISAIRAVLSGGQYFPKGYLSQRIVTQAQMQQSLTARQRQILELILVGSSNKMIASKLYLAEGTVRNHVSSLFEIFDVKSRSQLILAYVNRRSAAQPHTS